MNTQTLCFCSLIRKLKAFEICTDSPVPSMLRPRKKICVVPVTRPTLNFYPLTLNFFSKFRSWQIIAEQNNFFLLFSSNFRIWRKNMYQNDHLKWKSKFLCILSLVLEVNGLKQGYIFKNGPYYISFVLIFHLQAGLSIPRKKVFKILPTLFFSGCNLNHTYFFIWPYIHKVWM